VNRIAFLPTVLVRGRSNWEPRTKALVSARSCRGRPGARHPQYLSVSGWMVSSNGWVPEYETHGSNQLLIWL
jgi:hypothetical protein